MLVPALFPREYNILDPVDSMPSCACRLELRIPHYAGRRLTGIYLIGGNPSHVGLVVRINDDDPLVAGLLPGAMQEGLSAIGSPGKRYAKTAFRHCRIPIDTPVPAGSVLRISRAYANANTWPSLRTSVIQVLFDYE